MGARSAGGRGGDDFEEVLEMSAEKTSEEIYGIRKQPPVTCPMIDEALRELAAIAKCIRGHKKAEESELRDMLSEVETRIASLDGWNRTGLLEDIRGNVTDIRAWGQEWKTYALENAPKPEAEVLT